ncbi:MAG TPA: hypothetical protein VMT93_11090 [Gemmatimonadaceae bacterium]|nr:hypothetical protein [Gemmatimonadaceae bacterium]
MDLFPPRIWLVAGAILLLNVPFGYWREGLRKLSPKWFVAIHAPIPFAIALRFAAGLGFHLVTLPLFIAAYFAGQFAGGRLRRTAAPAGAS